LLGADEPYARPSNGSFQITVSDLALRLPVNDAPDCVQVLSHAPPVLPAYNRELAPDVSPTGTGPCGSAARTSLGAGSCLSRKVSVGGRGIGRVRLGRTRGGLLRGKVKPQRRTRLSLRYCVRRSSGTVRAVFSKPGSRRKVRLVVSTAKTHRTRRVGAGTSARRAARAFPRRRRLARGLFRAGPRSTRVVGIRRGRVRFLAVADRRLLGKPQVLRRYLRRAGLRAGGR